MDGPRVIPRTFLLTSLLGGWAASFAVIRTSAHACAPSSHNTLQATTMVRIVISTADHDQLRKTKQPTVFAKLVGRLRTGMQPEDSVGGFFAEFFYCRPLVAFSSSSDFFR